MIQALKRGTFRQSTNWMEKPVVHLTPLRSQKAPHTRETQEAAGRPADRSKEIPPLDLASQPSRPLTVQLPQTLARVENPNSYNEFTSIRIRPGGARNILRAHPPPANDAGNKFCMAWWTRGACFPNCGQRNTHVAFASSGERSRLLTYVRKHIQAPAAVTAST